MNTATINYKEVFELAKNKGYSLPFTITLEGNEDTQFPYHHPMEGRYIELCLIQKWLRDTHKIIVLVRPFNLGKSYFTSVLAPNIDRDFTTAEKENYESALLEGIAEALQLI